MHIKQGEVMWKCDLFGTGRFFGCDFQIGNIALCDLKEKIGRDKFYSKIPQDNMEALNNYGHIQPSEDFSDSPWLNG